MSTLSAGKEVLSFCKKCALNLAHTIVAMKDDQTIHKVECRTCKSVHAYKDPSSVSAKKSTKSSGMKRKKTSKKQSSTSVADLWLEAVSKATTKSRPYSVKEKFELGDIIDHPKFGPGIIDRLIDRDKVEVIFRHDIKTLIHNH